MNDCWCFWQLSLLKRTSSAEKLGFWLPLTDRLRDRWAAKEFSDSQSKHASTPINKNDQHCHQHADDDCLSEHFGVSCFLKSGCHSESYE